MVGMMTGMMMKQLAATAAAIRNQQFHPYQDEIPTQEL